MLLETLSLSKIYDRSTRENLNGVENETILSFFVFTLWVFMWIFTLFTAIKCAKTSNNKYNQTGLILSALSWPMYWLFKFSGVLC